MGRMSAIQASGQRSNGTDLSSCAENGVSQSASNYVRRREHDLASRFLLPCFSRHGHLICVVLCLCSTSMEHVALYVQYRQSPWYHDGGLAAKHIGILSITRVELKRSHVFLY